MSENSGKADSVIVEFSREECDMVVAAIGNALEFIEDPLFQTVVGWNKSELRPLIARLRSARYL